MEQRAQRPARHGLFLHPPRQRSGSARSDLAAAVEIIAAAEEVEKALEDATERLKRDFTDEALEEQQRLIEAQQGLKQRLAQLAGTD